MPKPNLRKYDVVVIGAGPAGAFAARTLSSQGFRVGLVGSRVSRTRPAGETLSAFALEPLRQLDLLEAFSTLNLPELSCFETTPRKGRSNGEIIHALHQVEGGEKVTEVGRRLGVSEQTFYRWKKQFTGARVAGAARAAIAAPRKRKIETSRRRPDARSPHPAGDRAKKDLNPRARCRLAEWTQAVYRLSQRRAARLIPVHNGTLRYRGTRDRQDALRRRLREIAAVRVRFGYRRLTVLLKREGGRVNANGSTGCTAMKA